MTYAECQQMFAKYGFTSTPITKQQFADLRKRKFSDLQIYGVGCDVHCGIRFKVAVEENK